MNDFIFNPNWSHSVDYEIRNDVVVLSWYNDFHDGSVEATDLATALKFMVEAITEKVIWNKDAIYKEFQEREKSLKSVRNSEKEN